jgi:predicted  nucleic acid-binding Zn-ribbon protein
MSPQADKIPVVCARCGWRGKRSRTSIWPACPRCGARADLILPIEHSKGGNPKNRQLARKL